MADPTAFTVGPNLHHEPGQCHTTKFVERLIRKTMSVIEVPLKSEKTRKQAIQRATNITLLRSADPAA